MLGTAEICTETSYVLIQYEDRPRLLSQALTLRKESRLRVVV
jgi:hypothetical protein